MKRALLGLVFGFLSLTAPHAQFSDTGVASESVNGSSGIAATRVQTFLQSMGVGLPQHGSARTIINNMAHLGLTTARQTAPYTRDGGGNYTLRSRRPASR
jgi:hypothetical protein